MREIPCVDVPEPSAQQKQQQKQANQTKGGLFGGSHTKQNTKRFEQADDGTSTRFLFFMLLLLRTSPLSVVVL